jgi:hypothetical protein
MDAFPLKLPGAAGVKVMVKLALAPGVKAKGKLGADRRNAAPLAVAALITRLLSPELVKTTDRDGVSPWATLPKLRLRELRLWPSASAWNKTIETVEKRKIAIERGLGEWFFTVEPFQRQSALPGGEFGTRSPESGRPKAVFGP